MGTRSIALVLVLMLLWAGNSVIVKIVVRDIPPLWAATLRFAMGLAIAWWLGRRGGVQLRVTPRECCSLAVYGLMATLQIFLFNAGASHTTGGRVTLFIFSYPLIVPFLAHWFLHGDPLRWRTVAGAVLACGGLVVALREGLAAETSTLRGDLMQLGSALVLAVMVVYNKRLTRNFLPLRILFWQFAVMLGAFTVSALLLERFLVTDVRPDAWGWLIYQGVVVSGFCFLGWQHLLRRHKSTQVSVFFFVTPIFGALLGWLLLGETPTSGLVMGATFVAFGIYLANRPDRRKRGLALSASIRGNEEYPKGRSVRYEPAQSATSDPSHENGS